MAPSKSFLNLRGGTDAFSAVKEEASLAVVNLSLTHPRNFGLTGASSSKATGYVVDIKEGIICSNKHVVNAGPCRAKARFLKNEEVDVLPIYRDPVHDFGFFKFDPKQLKDTKAVQIELDPEGAKRGRNALMIGNNGGEKISFVETTIARTDRGSIPLHDMNTFYITASDTSVGGSSGAPLLSVEGKAIAMMAAGNDSTNISHYLPLFRVARALEFIRKGEPVPRGTIQIGFKYQNFDTLLKRKAITEQVIENVKKVHAEAEGLLVVEKSLPKGPGKIAGMINGDILLDINKKPIINYVQLEEILDTFIGKKLNFTVMREGKEVILTPTVQDHKDIEVDQFVEVSNGIFHGTPYHIAAFVNIPIEGVFVANMGYMFGSVPGAAIVKRIGQYEVQNLDDFVKAVQALDNGQIVTVRYQPINDPNKIEIATVTADKRWYPFQLAKRNDSKGRWDYEELNVPSKKVDKKENAKALTVADTSDMFGSELEAVTGAILEVQFSVPFSIDGSYGGNTRSTIGFVVDKELGLVVATRDYIATTLIDIKLVFNRSKTIHAKVVFLNPEIPVAILQFDPRLLDGDTTVSLQSVNFSDNKPKIGEKLDYVGITPAFEFCIDEVKVVNFRDVNSHGGEMNGHQMAPLPHEVIGVNTSGLLLGVLVDQKTRAVKGYNISSLLDGQVEVAADVYPIIETVRSAVTGTKPLPQSTNLMPITTGFLDLSKARINDLPDTWADKLQKSMTLYQKKLIVVKRRMVGTDANAKLKENDVILTVDGSVVTLVRDFYALIRSKDQVNFKILRDAKEVDLTVKTTKFSTLGTTRIIHFGGLIVQNPHPAIFYLSTEAILEGKGVYVTFQHFGSPAASALHANEDQTGANQIVGKLIFKVNGQNVSNLEEFKNIVSLSKHDEFVRLVAKDIVTGEVVVHDIRLDLEYWKTRDMFLDENNDWASEYVNHSK